MKIIHFLSIVLIALVLLGCSFTVNVPTVSTTATKVLDISEPVPAGVDLSNIEIEMGAGSLKITPGSENLVEGTVTYNVTDWEPEISQITNGILISQTHTSNVGIPERTIKNEWDLKLGNSPIDLKISAGAYEGTIDLSGLSITNLEITDGASKAEVRFDTLNPAEMQHLVYKTGASQVDLIGLANANVSEIMFESGAGSYTLDFSGDLQKDIHVNITSGMSDIKVIVPVDTHTVVTLTSGLSNIDASGTWTINGSRYTSGTGDPTIYISMDMAVGNLSLVQE